MARKCPTCGAPAEDWQHLCSSCGGVIEAASDNQSAAAVREPADRQRGADSSRSWVAWLVLGLLLVAIAVLALSSSLGGGGGGGAPGAGWVSAPEVRTLGYDDPVLTAIELSREGWPNGAKTVVLCSIEDTAAVSVVGPLATAAGGPVLLANSGALDAEVLGRLKEMGTTRVLLADSAGHTDAYGQPLTGAGISVERVGGTGAVGVAVSVAKKANSLRKPNGYVIVSETQSARALYAAGFASGKSMPVLIMDSEGLEPYESLLSANRPRGIVVCTTSTVLPDALFEGKQFDDAVMDRVDAPDDAHFAQVFAEYAFAHGFEYERVLAVRATQLRHTYAVGPFAALTRSPLVVTSDTELGPAATRFFVSHASSVGDVRFLGPGGPSVDALLASTKEASETRINAKAVPLDQVSAAKVTAVASDTVTFQADPSIESSLAVGRIIVSGATANAPSGFLRRITAVQRSGATIVVTTEQASLSDVIDKGSFDIRVSAESSPVPAVAGGFPEPVRTALAAQVDTVMARQHSAIRDARAANEGARLLEVGRTASFDTPPIVVTKDWPKATFKTGGFPMPAEYGGGDGAFGLSADPRMRSETWIVLSGAWEDEPKKWGIFGGEKLVEFGLVVYSRFEFDLEYEVFFEWSGKDYKPAEKDLDEFLSKLPIDGLDKELTGPGGSARSAFAIGPIPVVLDSYYEPYCGLSGSFKGKLTGKIEKRLEVWFGVRVRLDDFKVTPDIGCVDNSSPIASPDFAGELEAKFATGVKVGTRFYGVVGPYVRGELYLKGNFKDNLTTGEYHLKISFGCEATVGGDIKILTWDIASFELDPVYVDFWKYERDRPARGDPGGGGNSPGTAPGGGGGGSWGGDGATSLVMDVSGSMSESFMNGSKLDQAKDAAQIVLDILEGTSAQRSSRIGVGVVEFSDDAQEALAPTGDYSDVRDAIEGMQTVSMTNIRRGIEEGTAQLASVSGPKVMILLSDGMDTMGNSREDIMAAVDDADDAGIKIFTIGFGDSGSLDMDLLDEIASTTGGTSSLADPSSLIGIGKEFIRATVLSTDDLLGEFEGAVAEGDTVEAGTFDVTGEKPGDMQAILYWPGSTLEMRLTDPDGAEVASGYPGYSVIRTETPAQIFVKNPKPGTWKMSVYGADTSMPEEPFYGLASFHETSGTPPPSTGGGGAPTGGGAELLLALVALAGAGGVATLIGTRRKSGSDELLKASGEIEKAAVPSPAKSNSPISDYVLSGQSGRVFTLRWGVNVVGRGSDADVIIDAPSVSRRHAVILVENGKVSIKDLGSTQGVRINGNLATQSPISVGDVVQLGEAKLTLRNSDG